MAGLPASRDERARWGARILHARQAQGISQQDLAAQLGISRRTISNIEHGHTVAQPDVLDSLLGALGLGRERIDADLEDFLSRLGSLMHQLEPVARDEFSDDVLALLHSRLIRDRRRPGDTAT